MALAWIVSAVIAWTRLVDKIDGQGVRVTDAKSALDNMEGRMDRMEREMFEYRRDAQDASKGLARVEKGIDDMRENIAQSTLQLGSQLHAMEKKNDDKDVRNQVRLARIETVMKIESKVGSLPSEQQ